LDYKEETKMKRLLIALLLLPAIASAQQVVPTRFISASPTVDTGSAYASGDLLGTKMTFTNALRNSVGTGYVIAVDISDKAAQAVDMDLVLFRQDPTNTTFTNNGAFSPADADLPKIIGVVNLAAASRFNFVDNGVKYLSGLALPIQGLSSTSASQGTLYGALVARGAYTGASSSDITVTLAIAQD
jgi:hypothetical protein